MGTAPLSPRQLCILFIKFIRSPSYYPNYDMHAFLSIQLLLYLQLCFRKINSTFQVQGLQMAIAKTGLPSMKYDLLQTQLGWVF